jgi:hypothetical protein
VRRDQRFLADISLILTRGEHSSAKRSIRFVARALASRKSTYWACSERNPAKPAVEGGAGHAIRDDPHITGSP